MKKIKISNKDIEKDITKVIKKLKKKKLDKERTLIIAIGRGGFVPAQYIAYGLNIRNLMCVQSILYRTEESDFQEDTHTITGVYFLDYEEYHTFVIVDDIYDTGITLDNTSAIIQDASTAMKFAVPDVIPVTIYSQQPKEILKEKNIIYGKIVPPTKKGKKQWVVFPWDRINK